MSDSLADCLISPLNLVCCGFEFSVFSSQTRSIYLHSSRVESAYNANNSALLPFLRHLFLNFPFFDTPVIFLSTACVFVLENPGVAQPTQASAQQMAFYYPRLGYGYTLSLHSPSFVCVLFILAPRPRRQDSRSSMLPSPPLIPTAVVS